MGFGCLAALFCLGFCDSARLWRAVFMGVFGCHRGLAAGLANIN